VALSEELGWIDFFIIICGLSQKEQTRLTDQILDLNNNIYQCPLLIKNGCFLEFNSRPAVCTNAYPCFAGQLYREFLENKKKADKKRLFLSGSVTPKIY